MIKKIFIILIILINTSCSFKNMVKHHGVHFLEKKQTKLKILESNTNDTKKILGYPSTKNTFDNDIWIYIERKTTVSQIKTLGKKKLLTNNVLVLEFDRRGILLKKDFYTMKDMNDIKVAEDKTDVLSQKDTFVRSIMNTLRQKINDPLGKRQAK
tara:strand:+ start:184 stop:648 length:465 start_codon:yes stop_codon:yes gene_type:complete